MIIFIYGLLGFVYQVNIERKEVVVSVGLNLGKVSTCHFEQHSLTRVRPHNFRLCMA